MLTIEMFSSPMNLYTSQTGLFISKSQLSPSPFPPIFSENHYLGHCGNQFLESVFHLKSNQQGHNSSELRQAQTILPSAENPTHVRKDFLESGSGSPCKICLFFLPNSISCTPRHWSPSKPVPNNKQIREKEERLIIAFYFSGDIATQKWEGGERSN